MRCPMSQIPPGTKFVTSDGYEICILCHERAEPPVRYSTHIDFRAGFVEGSGQTCTNKTLCEERQRQKRLVGVKKVIPILLFILLSAIPVYGQINQMPQAPTESPVFDKKFWTVVGALIGSEIVLTEAAVYKDQNNQSSRRMEMYTAYGISDFFILAASANLKSDGKRWWWVLPIVASSVNGGIAVRCVRNF